MSHLHMEPEEFELFHRDLVTLVEGHSPGLDVNSALLFKAEIMTISIKKYFYGKKKGYNNVTLNAD